MTRLREHTAESKLAFLDQLLKLKRVEKSILSLEAIAERKNLLSKVQALGRIQEFVIENETKNELMSATQSPSRITLRKKRCMHCPPEIHKHPTETQMRKKFDK